MTEDIKTAQNVESKPAKLEIRKLVLRAIKNLKEKNGVNLNAIKNYITANNDNFDMDSHEKDIKLYLARAVKNGTLEQIPNDSKGSKGKFKIAEKKVVSKGPHKKPVAVPKEKKKDLSPEEKLKQEVKKMKLSQTGYMVLHALYNLKERKGSMLVKVRNYIIAHFKIELKASLKYQTKKFVSDCVQSGILVTVSEERGGRYKIANFLLDTIKKKIEDPLPEKRHVAKSIEQEQPVEKSSTSEKKKKKSTTKTTKTKAATTSEETGTKGKQTKKAVTSEESASEQQESAEEEIPQATTSTKVAPKNKKVPKAQKSKTNKVAAPETSNDEQVSGQEEEEEAPKKVKASKKKAEKTVKKNK